MGFYQSLNNWAEEENPTVGLINYQIYPKQGAIKHISQSELLYNKGIFTWLLLHSMLTNHTPGMSLVETVTGMGEVGEEDKYDQNTL